MQELEYTHVTGTIVMCALGEKKCPQKYFQKTTEFWQSIQKNDIQVKFCEIDSLLVKLMHFLTPIAGHESVEKPQQYQLSTDVQELDKYG